MGKVNRNEKDIFDGCYDGIIYLPERVDSVQEEFEWTLKANVRY